MLYELGVGEEGCDFCGLMPTGCPVCLQTFNLFQDEL